MAKREAAGRFVAALFEFSVFPLWRVKATCHRRHAPVNLDRLRLIVIVALARPTASLWYMRGIEKARALGARLGVLFGAAAARVAYFSHARPL